MNIGDQLDDIVDNLSYSGNCDLKSIYFELWFIQSIIFQLQKKLSCNLMI